MQIKLAIAVLGLALATAAHAEPAVKNCPSGFVQAWKKWKAHTDPATMPVPKARCRMSDARHGIYFCDQNGCGRE
jgi:hypothetical protein